jgi:hypothetical protein
MDNLCDPKKNKIKTYLAVIKKKERISQYWSGHKGYNIISADNIQGYVEYASP